MLELQILRDQRERAVNGLKKRNLGEDRLALVDQIISLDDERKNVQTLSGTEHGVQVSAIFIIRLLHVHHQFL